MINYKSRTLQRQAIWPEWLFLCHFLSTLFLSAYIHWVLSKFILTEYLWTLPQPLAEDYQCYKISINQKNYIDPLAVTSNWYKSFGGGNRKWSKSTNGPKLREKSRLWLGVGQFTYSDSTANIETIFYFQPLPVWFAVWCLLQLMHIKSKICLWNLEIFRQVELI